MLVPLAAFLAYAASDYRQIRAMEGGLPRGAPPLIPDAEIGFTMNLGARTLVRVRGTSRSVETFTNPQGFHVDSEQVGQRLDHADILAVGCSFTFGQGVRAQDAYPAVLGSAAGVTVANAGRFAYGTVGSFLTLKRWAGLGPRIVIYGFIEGHLARNLAQCGPTRIPVCRPQVHVSLAGGGPDIKAPPSLPWDESLVQDLMAGLSQPEGLGDALLGARLLMAEAWTRLMASRVSMTPSDQEAALAHVLGRMKAESDRIGAKLIVVNIPQGLAGVHGGAPLKGPSDILVRAMPPGVELMDMTPAIAALPPQVSLGLSATDGHPTAAVHAVIGKELAARLALTR